MAIGASKENNPPSRKGLLSRVQSVLASEKNISSVSKGKKKQKKGNRSLLKQALNILYKEEILNRPQVAPNEQTQEQSFFSKDASQDVSAKNLETAKGESQEILNGASLAQAIDSLQKVLSQFMAPYLNPEVLKELAKKLPTAETQKNESEQKTSSDLPTPFDNSVLPESQGNFLSPSSSDFSSVGSSGSPNFSSSNVSPSSSEFSSAGSSPSSDFSSPSSSEFSSAGSSPSSDFSSPSSCEFSSAGSFPSSDFSSPTFESKKNDDQLFDQFVSSLPSTRSSAQEEDFSQTRPEQSNSSGQNFSRDLTTGFSSQNIPQDIFQSASPDVSQEKKFDKIGMPFPKGSFPPPLQPAYNQESTSPQGYLSRTQDIYPSNYGVGYVPTFGNEKISGMPSNFQEGSLQQAPPSPIEQPMYPAYPEEEQTDAQSGNVLNSSEIPSLDTPHVSPSSPSAFTPQEEQVQEIKGVLELKPPELEDSPYLTLTYDFKKIPHDFSLAKDHNILEYAYYKYKPMLLKAQNFVKHRQIAHGLNYYRTIREQKIPEELKEMIDRNIQDINDFLYKYLMSGADEEY